MPDSICSSISKIHVVATTSRFAHHNVGLILLGISTRQRATTI